MLYLYQKKILCPMLSCSVSLDKIGSTVLKEYIKTLTYCLIQAQQTSPGQSLSSVPSEHSITLLHRALPGTHEPSPQVISPSRHPAVKSFQLTNWPVSSLWDPFSHFNLCCLVSDFINILNIITARKFSRERKE